MGIVVATKPRALGSARIGTDFQPRTKEQLYQWYMTIVQYLKRGQRGTEQLCTVIFGEDGVTSLMDQGKLASNSDQPRVPSSSRAAQESDNEDQQEVRLQKRRRV